MFLLLLKIKNFQNFQNFQKIHNFPKSKNFAKKEKNAKMQNKQKFAKKSKNGLLCSLRGLHGRMASLVCLIVLINKAKNK
jgi:hypothetical protein